MAKASKVPKKSKKTQASKPPKAAKKRKTPSRRHSAPRSMDVALTTSTPQNLVYFADDGQVVVVTSTGQVSIVTDATVAAELKAALLQRQQAALDLTEVLRDAGYDVIAGSTTGHGP